MAAQAVTVALFEERDLIARARRHDQASIRTLVRQHNRRLYRIARSILKDDWEAEDAVQETYIRAFTHLSDFEGRSQFSTWLTRIVINESLGRLRRRKPTVDFNDEMSRPAPATAEDDKVFAIATPQPDPEQAMAQTEIRQILEHAIDTLPNAFRIVLVARDIEELSIEDTAELYGLRPGTVRTRLHRARAMLRANLTQKFGLLLTETFPFDGKRCENMADRVIARLYPDV
jgi:RNA polymerase sigma-70 factor (ECF subfamily)